MNHNIWNIGKVRVRKANWSRHGAKEEEEGAKRDQSAICMCTSPPQECVLDSVGLELYHPYPPKTHQTRKLQKRGAPNGLSREKAQKMGEKRR
jgi:hypothetical protein